MNGVEWNQCPLTFEEIKEPVIDPCGHTFEKGKIEGWLKDHSTCPVSRKALAQSNYKGSCSERKRLAAKTR